MVCFLKLHIIFLIASTKSSFLFSAFNIGNNNFSKYIFALSLIIILCSSSITKDSILNILFSKICSLKKDINIFLSSKDNLSSKILNSFK